MKVEIAVEVTNIEKVLDDYNPRQAEIEILLTRLKTLRKLLADQENIAPYVIFGDSTLKSMAYNQPDTPAKFAELSGINDYKMQKYGDIFISEIRSFRAEQNLPIALPSHTQMKTLQLYQQGLSLEKIAYQRGLSVGTIIDHFIGLIETNQPIKLEDFVDTKKQEIITNLIEETGGKSLKDLKEKLGYAYTYDEIKLVRAWYNRVISNE
jgi:ATP-dependent DNA helicase RecQ